MSEEIKDEIVVSEIEIPEGSGEEVILSLSDKELEAVNGGAHQYHVKVRNLAGFCPYCLSNHNGIQEMQEMRVINGYHAPVYYCTKAQRYFITGRCKRLPGQPAWFDLQLRLLWPKNIG